MGRKNLIVIGVIITLFTLQSCQQHPEQGLLKRYFEAVSLKDVTTMSTMALEPITLEIANWKIVNVGEETVEPANLPDLNKTELELKKKLEDHVAPTIDAKDELDIAKDDLAAARTRDQKAALQRKVDALQATYDQIYEVHKELQKNYNDAKALSIHEEEVTSFSLGAGDLPNIRAMSGERRSKDVEVSLTTKDGATKNYIFSLKIYNLKDETLNIQHRGRWIIDKVQSVG